MVIGQACAHGTDAWIDPGNLHSGFEEEVVARHKDPKFAEETAEHMERGIKDPASSNHSSDAYKVECKLREIMSLLLHGFPQPENEVNSV